MKKTQIRRKKPLRLGKYPLQRLAGALIQQEFERRKAMKRKPLRKNGARAKREAKSWRIGRAAAMARAGPNCERCGHDGRWPRRLEVHHRIPRSRAASHEEKHSPKNLIVLCGGSDDSCHAIIHRREGDWQRWIS